MEPLSRDVRKPGPRRTTICPKCGATKVVIKNGSLRCPSCAKANLRRYYREDKLLRMKKSAQRVESTYGITMRDVEAMFDAQGHRCAICRTLWWLLCHKCNSAIARFHERPERILAAIAYLSSDAES
jgi:uncharacterized Zn finger protein (UPF0148 family)